MLESYRYFEFLIETYPLFQLTPLFDFLDTFLSLSCCLYFDGLAVWLFGCFCLWSKLWIHMSLCRSLCLGSDAASLDVFVLEIKQHCSLVPQSSHILCGDGNERPGQLNTDFTSVQFPFWSPFCCVIQPAWQRSRRRKRVLSSNLRKTKDVSTRKVSQNFKDLEPQIDQPVASQLNQHFQKFRECEFWFLFEIWECFFKSGLMWLLLNRATTKRNLHWNQNKYPCFAPLQVTHF